MQKRCGESLTWRGERSHDELCGGMCRAMNEVMIGMETAGEAYLKIRRDWHGDEGADESFRIRTLPAFLSLDSSLPGTATRRLSHRRHPSPVAEAGWPVKQRSLVAKKLPAFLSSQR